jgi:hypothetical protein
VATVYSIRMATAESAVLSARAHALAAWADEEATGAGPASVIAFGRAEGAWSAAGHTPSQ